VTIVLLALGGFVLAAALLRGLVWFLGLDAGRVTRPIGASVTEAGERTADLAAEFWDWLRLGR
jgi:hypothetical protein